MIELSTQEQETRQRILQMADQMFLTRGYSIVTMSDMADELGMSKKTLYKYFDDKQTLLEDVIDMHFQRIEQMLDDNILNTGMDFMEKLKCVISCIIRETLVAGTHLLADIRRNAPRAFAKIEHWRGEHIRLRYSQLLDEGIQKGFFRSDLKKDIVMMFYIGSIDWLTVQSSTNTTFPLHELMDHFLKLFYEGLMTDSARLKYRLETQGTL